LPCPHHQKKPCGLCLYLLYNAEAVWTIVHASSFIGIDDKEEKKRRDRIRRKRGRMYHGLAVSAQEQRSMDIAAELKRCLQEEEKL
jgi:hypothetical protein